MVSGCRSELNGNYLLLIVDIQPVGKSLGEGVSPALQTPGALAEGAQDVRELKVRTGVQPQEAQAFVRIGLIPGQIHQAQRAEDFLQRFAGSQPAHRVKAPVAASTLPGESVQDAAGLCIGL